MEIIKYAHRFFGGVREIHEQSFGDEKMSDKMLMEELLNPSRRYFVGVEDKEVVGYIGAWNTKTDYSIISIAIKSEYRGRGFAKQLIERVFEDAKWNDVYSISLEVNEENHAAISLYRSMGFIITNTRKNYYKGGKSAHIMWKYL